MDFIQIRHNSEVGIVSKNQFYSKCATKNGISFYKCIIHECPGHGKIIDKLFYPTKEHIDHMVHYIEINELEEGNCYLSSHPIIYENAHSKKDSLISLPQIDSLKKFSYLDSLDKIHELNETKLLTLSRLNQLIKICQLWKKNFNFKIVKLSNNKNISKFKKLICINCGDSFKIRSAYLAHVQICKIKSISNKLILNVNSARLLDENEKIHKKDVVINSNDGEINLKSSLKMVSNPYNKNTPLINSINKDFKSIKRRNQKFDCVNNKVVNSNAKEENFEGESCSEILINNSHKKETPIESYDNIDSLVKNVFTCSTCSKIFTTNQSLRRHLTSHINARPFICDICHSTYKQKEFLKIHYTKHTDIHKYKCTYCDMSTYLKRSLIVHMRIHSKERRFICSECGMCFAYANSLNLHSRTHTGEKPFKCNDCGRHFSSKSNLQAHRLLHTGEKNFKCVSCDKKFMTNAALKKHFRQHNGDRPFKCNICTKTFCINSTLKTHMKIHTGERPHVCHFCSKAFIRNAHLIRHLESIHKYKMELNNHSFNSNSLEGNIPFSQNILNMVEEKKKIQTINIENEVKNNREAVLHHLVMPIKNKFSLTSLDNIELTTMHKKLSFPIHQKIDKSTACETVANMSSQYLTNSLASLSSEPQNELYK